MVRHIVGWNFAPGMSEEEKKVNTSLIKTELEKLKTIIPGIISIQVLTCPLDTSESDLMLDSVFENEEALKSYTVHPEHVKVATTYVRPVTMDRKCLDFSMHDL